MRELRRLHSLRHTQSIRRFACPSIWLAQAQASPLGKKIFQHFEEAIDHIVSITGHGCQADIIEA